jgi:hypothetical protein
MALTNSPGEKEKIEAKLGKKSSCEDQGNKIDEKTGKKHS